VSGDRKVGICTDSNSQLPAALAERFAIEVVPLTVTIDGVEYLEGIDIDADSFYAHFANGRAPVVSTSQPSPGQFAVAYEQLISAGCTDILSVHVSAAVSGTLNAARLAARTVPVPVRLVDSSTASFGISCCVWAAAEAVEAGASLDEAAQVAENLAPSIRNVFVVSSLDLLRQGGRAAAATSPGQGVQLLTLHDGEVQVLGAATDMVDAVISMASFAIGAGERVHVAVGHSDTLSAPLADALEDAVAAAANVVDVVRYRVGPSVGAHTGPGTSGCFTFPAR